ncbi:MAG: S8 family serine peptidase [Colwellia sp.]|nr:S8 family serine peptidase [Colwellia sp.]
MFKKMMIATAISTALTPSVISAENNQTLIQAIKEVKSAKIVNKRFIVKLKNKKPLNVSQAAQQRLNPISLTGKSKIKYKRKLASGDLLIEASEYSSMQSLIDDLSLNGEVLAIEEDDIVNAHTLPNDHYAASMYSIENSYRGINAIAAWGLSRGRDVNVAIIDTGFTDHPDYDERSINGYDMISYTAQSIDGDARDADAHDPGTGIDCEGKNSIWHGTHVAGIIGASMNNDIGAVGIAPEANLIHVRALGKCGSGYRSDIIDAIYWAVGKEVANLPINTQPAKVINLSLGGSSACGSYQEAIDYARSQGTTVVVSAGNNNLDASQQSPANCDGVITVAASDNSGDKASYSNYSAINGAVDITAPGSSIIATINSGLDGPLTPGYSFKSGTSMAAPQVAGVVALMLEKNPLLTPDQTEDIIKSTANQFQNFTTCNTQGPICGYGLLNAEEAVKEAIALIEPSAPTLEKNTPITISAAQNEQLLFSFLAPENASDVTFSISDGDGDADLYVKYDGIASLDNFDCRPWLSGNNESCTLTGSGNYSIMVRGYNSYSDVTLTANYVERAPAQGIEIGNDDIQWELNGEYHQELLFWVDVPDNITGLWVQTWSGTGDADLWVKKGSAPTAQDNDCFESNPGNVESCTMEAEGGRFFIKVRGYNVFNRVAMRILWND